MNRPAPVEVTYKNMRYLITHHSTNATLKKFTEKLKKIYVLDWPFDDGAPPFNQTLDDWLSLVKTEFHEDPSCCIAVHCVASRALVLVTLALIEGGMKYEHAVQFPRQKWRRTFNSKPFFFFLELETQLNLSYTLANTLAW
uniref:Tyrosine specific protein phosphatases domain-containing protein n=1 Tax=Sus scrofa TaxID=9823 RepID=A0A8D0S595_PIG